MRVLVFDDNPVHREAAEAQLKGHDLTVVATYDEARALLEPQVNHEQVKVDLATQFGEFRARLSDDEAKSGEYFAFRKMARERATTYTYFDVVLTDLLVPASAKSQLYDGLAGQEMPVGIFIALLAVKGGAPHAAVFTDSSHHDHPASACFDPFNHSGGESAPTVFLLGGCKVLLCNTRAWMNCFDRDDLSRQLETPAEIRECNQRHGIVRAKNWAKLLAYLTTCS